MVVQGWLVAVVVCVGVIFVEGVHGWCDMNTKQAEWEKIGLDSKEVRKVMYQPWSGCSTDRVPFVGNVGYFKEFKTVMHEACMYHDMCYHCGEKHGLSQEHCDRLMYENMKHTCGRSSKKSMCPMRAWTLYKGTQMFGHEYYKNPSPDDANTCGYSGIKKLIELKFADSCTKLMPKKDTYLKFLKVTLVRGSSFWYKDDHFIKVSDCNGIVQLSTKRGVFEDLAEDGKTFRYKINAAHPIRLQLWNADIIGHDDKEGQSECKLVTGKTSFTIPRGSETLRVDVDLEEAKPFVWPFGS